MGGFLSFVKKEALHILRDKRTMLIVLLLPIVQILLFGFAISTEMNNIDFAVVAPNRTETIRQQIERMEANPYFTFKGLQFRAGNHGIDFYFDLCHDDFCIYREGKRDRYDGGIVGVAGATDMDHFCQDDSLFFAFVRESCRYSGIGTICPRSTDVGFDGWFSRAFFTLFGAFTGIRIVYFYNG